MPSENQGPGCMQEVKFQPQETYEGEVYFYFVLSYV